MPRSALRGVRPIQIDKIVTCITDDRVVVTLQVSHEIRPPDLLGPVRRIVTEDFMAQPHNAGAPGATGIPIAPDLNLHDLNLAVQGIQRSVDQLVMDSELHRKTIERLVRWLGA